MAPPSRGRGVRTLMWGCSDAPTVGQWGLEAKGHSKYGAPPHTHTASWTGGGSGRRGHGWDRTRLRASRVHVGAPGGRYPPGSWNQWSFNHRPLGLASNCPHWLPLWPRPESKHLLHAHPLGLSQSLPPSTQPAAHAWLPAQLPCPHHSRGARTDISVQMAVVCLAWVASEVN